MEAMSAPSLKAMSVEEYLRSEETSPYKREYVGGYVYPLHPVQRGQAGASGVHIRIGLNIVRALDDVALAQGCLMYTSDMKLQLLGADNFYYPDVMMVCGHDQLTTHPRVQTTPCLLVEVLSPSTASNDRLAKHAAYTSIPSLQTYLIAEQTARRVYVYQRRRAGWQASEVVGSGSIELPWLGAALTLDQIYRALPL